MLCCWAWHQLTWQVQLLLLAWAVDVGSEAFAVVTASIAVPLCPLLMELPLQYASGIAEFVVGITALVLSMQLLKLLLVALLYFCHGIAAILTDVITIGVSIVVGWLHGEGRVGERLW
jgi:hypothetical protein